MTYRQGPPNAIQVESTEGCNLRCGFCGIRGITEKSDTGGSIAPDGAYHFMVWRVADSLAHQVKELGWNPRFEFAMHGEPTLNPALPDLVYAIRRRLPSAPIMVTTNGIPMLPDWQGRIRELIRAGANTIAVDNYRPYRCEEAFRSTHIPGVTRYDYPKAGQKGSPHRRPKAGENRLILVEDILTAAEGNHSVIFNHAGCAFPKDPDAKGRCAKPFREMSVRYDGNVAICCDDWRGEFKVGNVERDGVEAIWHHEAMYAARRMLYSGERAAGPCQGCTHRSTRVGLLPDRMGRETLPPPSAEDFALIAEATSGPSYAEPVLRRWEKVTIKSAST